MRLTDSHLHLWDPHVLHYAWLNEVPQISGPQLPEHRFADESDLQAAIVVQADCSPEQAIEEARWVAHLAQSAPFKIAGIVAHIALDKPKTLSAQLNALQEIPHVVGVRHSLQNEALSLFYDADYRQGMATIAEAGLTLDICVRSHQLSATWDLLNWLFNKIPTARVVLDHLGKPNIAHQNWSEWQHNFDRLTSFNALWCKISGLPTEANWDAWQDDDLLPWIRHAIDKFGPGRCMFGGDWPVVKLAGGYTRWKQCVLKAIAQRPEKDQQSIMSDNTMKFYLNKSGGI